MTDNLDELDLEILKILSDLKHKVKSISRDDIYKLSKLPSPLLDHLQRLYQGLDNISKPHNVNLTDQELTALKLMAEGLNLAQSADRMNRCVNAVKQYRSGAKQKLNANTTTHAVVIAIKYGYIVL